MKAWHSTAASLFLLTCLAACGGGGSDDGSEGDITQTPPPTSGGNPPPPPPPAEEGPILHENFGDGLFVNFNEADTIYFFSPDYKALAANNPQDPRPSFYYPTCCFFANDKPADGPEVNLDQMGIVNDSGNPSMLLNTGRFSVGQNLPDVDKSDPKKDSTTNEDTSTWGELNLSEPYRISFCVKEATGTRNMQIYVDNNSSGEANSYHGGGSQGSRIFNMPVNQLVTGTRVVVNIPGDTLVDGALADTRPALVGTGTSFLQFRVEGGSSVIFDDLLVEYQDDDGQADLPACNVFTPATVPDPPEAPGTIAGDQQITASWPEVVGATQYDIAWGTANDVDTATWEENVTSPLVLAELNNGTEYFVFLRVKNAVGWGEWSLASNATPEAPPEPVGDACVPTNQVDTTISWSVYDGCLSPSEAGSVVYNTSVQSTFDFGSSDTTLFSAISNDENENLGTALLDTTADPALKSRGEFEAIFAEGYPKHFTAIARIKSHDPAQRGFELQTYFGEANKRVNMLLRPDQGDGRIHLEKFTDGGTDVKADVPAMLDGDFHTYHIAFTMTDADTLTVKVYFDGSDTPVIDEVSTGRTSSGENKFRVGEDSSSAHLAEVDWIIWTTEAATAAKVPSELIDQLPESIGELGAYVTQPILTESFNEATDGDGASSNFFTAAYKSISGDGTKAFYNVASSGSRISLGSGQLSFYNARFTIGDTNPAAGDTADTDTSGRGDLDLSAPYTIRFDVAANDNLDDGSGKCQIYVDNSTTSSGKSMHGSASKIFEKSAVQLADGDQVTGTVTIASDPENHVGTATSFLQFRCDSGVETPITIDNLVIERQ